MHVGSYGQHGLLEIPSWKKRHSFISFKWQSQLNFPIFVISKERNVLNSPIMTNKQLPISLVKVERNCLISMLLPFQPTRCVSKWIEKIQDVEHLCIFAHLTLLYISRSVMFHWHHNNQIMTILYYKNVELLFGRVIRKIFPTKKNFIIIRLSDFLYFLGEHQIWK